MGTPIPGQQQQIVQIAPPMWCPIIIRSAAQASAKHHVTIHRQVKVIAQVLVFWPMAFVTHATRNALLVSISTPAATQKLARIARKGSIRTKLVLLRVRNAQMAKLLIPRDLALRMIAQPQAGEKIHREKFRK